MSGLQRSFQEVERRRFFGGRGQFPFDAREGDQVVQREPIEVR
jgi:hypothetical protein